MPGDREVHELGLLDVVGGECRVGQVPVAGRHRIARLQRLEVAGGQPVVQVGRNGLEHSNYVEKTVDVRDIILEPAVGLLYRRPQHYWFLPVQGICSGVRNLL